MMRKQQHSQELIHVPFVTILSPDNAKLLHKLKLGFKGKINWKKYQS